MWARLSKNNLTQMSAGVELPLQAELFIADQIKLHGKLLSKVPPGGIDARGIDFYRCRPRMNTSCLTSTTW